MQVQQTCLLVVADGSRARLFEERRRGAPLAERSDWMEGLAPESVEAPPRGRVFQRFGPGSHTVDSATPRERSEERFLNDLAERVGMLVAREGFDEVALIAPPRALGVLRAALPSAAADRPGPSEPAERCEETADELRAVLRRLRTGD